MSFYRETRIKAVRKARCCEGCGTMLNVGEPALYIAGNFDGDFWSGTFHLECREAEEALNKLHGAFADEWTPLCELDSDDWPWLLEAFPAVAARKGITAERIATISHLQHN